MVSFIHMDRQTEIRSSSVGSMTIRLRTFGSVYLADDGKLLSGAAGQRRLLAILSVLAVAGERGITRDKLLALLWPEGEPDKARHALTQ